LGGQWANESWGRYWGWDPKETWALISIMIYALVVHEHIIPAIRGKFKFNVMSMFAVWVIMMTYFGVNFYLSGLHSYAKGDPVQTPAAVYIAFAVMVVTAVVAYFRYKKMYKS
jgi:cytochrome c biogenesis factor